MTGTFVLPTPQRPAGSTGAFGATIFVGIDGDTCSSATFQTGIDIHDDGSTITYNGDYLQFLAAILIGDPDFAHTSRLV